MEGVEFVNVDIFFLADLFFEIVQKGLFIGLEREEHEIKAKHAEDAENDLHPDINTSEEKRGNSIGLEERELAAYVQVAEVENDARHEVGNPGQNIVKLGIKSKFYAHQ